MLRIINHSLAIILCCLLSLTVYAGNFSINPLRATLSANKKVSSLTVMNRGNEPTTIQLETVAWTQDAQGKDVLVPTTDLLANPPIFTIPPQGKQIVRVGLRRPITENQEVTYRLLLNETPPPLKPDFTGVNFAVRMSIPIFVMPKNSVEPKLQWSLTKKDQDLVLNAENIGTAHSQIISVRLEDTTGTILYKQLISNYLLPQQKRQWPIPVANVTTGMPVKLIVETDSKPIEQDLIVQ